MKRIMTLFYIATLLAFLGKSILPSDPFLIAVTTENQSHKEKFNPAFTSAVILLANQGERIVSLLQHAGQHVPAAFLAFLSYESPNEFYFSNKIFAYSLKKNRVGYKYRKTLAVFPTHYFW